MKHSFISFQSNHLDGSITKSLTKGVWTERGCADAVRNLGGLSHASVGLRCCDRVQASVLAAKLSCALMPLVRPLFGKASADQQAMEAVSANVAANLLGLSNAATPLGLQAADRLYTLEGRRGAPDSVLTLITLNTASIQLIPSTVAAVRAACGAATPFDIMLPVWGASLFSVAVVLLSGRLLRPVFREEK